MKISIICDVLGEENNGTTIAAMNLIRHLKSAGHSVTVVCPDESRRDEDGFVVVDRINFGPFNNYVAKNGVVIAKPSESELRRAIRGADVVHIETPFFLSAKAVKIAEEYSIPVTASFHCQAENFTNHIFLMGSGFANNLVYRLFYNFVFSHCVSVHYPTQFIRDEFERELGVNTNGYIISNGVSDRFVRFDAQKPEEFSDKFVILFTGRYSREKSHAVLIDGVAKSKYADKIQLIFAGCGPRERKIRSYAQARLKNMPLFRFFGRDEMLQVLNYSDLYVHPAEIEIEAIACLEAIKCGLTPIIANSPKSATRFFALTPNNLFKYDNPLELAEKIDYWIEHGDERRQNAALYRGFIKQFDREVCMRRLEQMIVDAAKTQKVQAHEEHEVTES